MLYQVNNGSATFMCNAEQALAFSKLGYTISRIEYVQVSEEELQDAITVSSLAKQVAPMSTIANNDTVEKMERHELSDGSLYGVVPDSTEEHIEVIGGE